MSEDVFKSTNLYEMAFLRNEGMQQIRIEGDSKRCHLVFKNKQKCEKLSEDFFNNKAVVRAKQFADAIRDVKDIIYAYKDKCRGGGE